MSKQRIGIGIVIAIGVIVLIWFIWYINIEMTVGQVAELF